MQPPERYDDIGSTPNGPIEMDSFDAKSSSNKKVSIDSSVLSKEDE